MRFKQALFEITLLHLYSQSLDVMSHVKVRHVMSLVYGDNNNQLFLEVII